MPVVRTDGRAVYGHVITKFSLMGSLPHFFTHGAALRAREQRYKLIKEGICSVAVFYIAGSSVIITKLY